HPLRPTYCTPSSLDVLVLLFGAVRAVSAPVAALRSVRSLRIQRQPRTEPTSPTTATIAPAREEPVNAGDPITMSRRALSVEAVAPRSITRVSTLGSATTALPAATPARTCQRHRARHATQMPIAGSRSEERRVGDE